MIDHRLKENQITSALWNIFIKIHNVVGPGLYEEVYEDLVCYELEQYGLPYVRQKEINLEYGGKRFERAYRADIIVDGCVLIELKSVESIHPKHFKQVQTYLKLSGIKVAILINFNEALVKEGYHRIVNNL
jgi:GxxExxY protein